MEDNLNKLNPLNAQQDIIDLITGTWKLPNNEDGFYIRNVSRPTLGQQEGNVLFNDSINIVYLRLYGVRNMIKDDSDSEGETRCHH